MTESKKILLIGRSGRGKSALANVLTNTNKFKESSGSASETKKVQSEEFEFDPDQGKLEKLSERLKQSGLDKEDQQTLQKVLDFYVKNKEVAKYRIIDTPGIGDTKMSDNEVLDIIAEAVYLAKDGINQVFFVVNGRFDQSEMATYNLLRTIIFDQDITNHTTITRTNFENFKSSKKCQADSELMIKEAKDKKQLLENNLTTKKQQLATLSADDGDKYQELDKEINQLEQELTVTNLAEIMESCQNRFVHVDNPPLEISGAEEEELNSNQNKRTKSRAKLLIHLQSSYQEVPYKPKKLQELSKEIADVYFDYMNKKNELGEELRKLSDSKQISKTKVNKNMLKNSNIGIVDAKIIAQLEDKKSKLKQEIQEKEKVIRQKVLKHIFNNYDEVNKTQGGNIFLDSVTKDNNNWSVISKEFTEKKLILQWRSNSFTYQQVHNWSLALKDNFSPKYDVNFVTWLRDNKHLTIEEVEVFNYVIRQLRNEYNQWLIKVNGLLENHNQKINLEDKKLEEKSVEKMLEILQRKNHVLEENIRKELGEDALEEFISQIEIPLENN